jgi:hypothetical protein
MSRDRFRHIKSALHFAEERVKPDGADALYKVEDLMDPLLNRCRTIFQLSEHVSADEAGIRFESKLGPQSIQYMNQPKPISECAIYDCCAAATTSVATCQMASFAARASRRWTDG